MANLATLHTPQSLKLAVRSAASISTQSQNARLARFSPSCLPHAFRALPPSPRIVALSARAGKQEEAVEAGESQDNSNGAPPVALIDKQQGEEEEGIEQREKEKKKDKKKEKKEGKDKEKSKSGALMYMTDTEGDRLAKGAGWLTDGPITAKAHYPDDAAAHASAMAGQEGTGKEHSKKKKTSKEQYEKELDKLKVELVKLQEWIRTQKLRVVVLFEGRDAAGKGGIIKTISEATNPRVVSIKALAKPSDRERTQWYFQRYVAELPAGGEMVLFDRSWYNRAGVERVMGFYSDEEYKEFLRSCPEFERMLVRSGIILLKYWISVSPEEQERRFKERLSRPEKRWKLSDMDLESRARWSDYSQAKDIMFGYTDIKQAPWFVVPADDKKAARLNCLAHLLSKIEYEDIIRPNDLKLPPLQEDHYVRPPITDQTFVPQVY